VSTIKRNLVANFAANAWMAVVSLVLVPLYIRFMGIEAYGLMGVYGTLQALASLLDMGLSTTMGREMARLSTRQESACEARNLVRTLETIYWAVAVLIGIVVMALVPVLAQYWITTVHLSRVTVQQAVFLIGIVMLFQWPFSFYASGLMGLQRQILLGAVNAGVATLRGIGAVLILWLVSPTVQAFFGWQIAISITSTILVALLLWHSLPRSAVTPTFQIGQLKRVWRFAAGISAVSVLGLALLQTDKIVLSKILTLEKFGYYTLAASVSANLYMIVKSVYSVVFPRCTQLVTAADQEGLKRFYHRSSEVMSVLLLPMVVVLALFSREILLVWIGNSEIAANTCWLLTLLVIGAGLHGLAHIPWAVQLAHGWTKLGFYQNLAAVFMLVPLIIVLAYRYGAIGAAAMWVVVNLGTLVIGQQVMHRRLLRDELRRWYLADVGQPALAALIVAGVGRLLIHGNIPRLLLLLFLVIVSGCTLVAAAFTVPAVRVWVLLQLKKRRAPSMTSCNSSKTDAGINTASGIE